MKVSGVITNDHAKGQGQRSKVKVTTQLNGFRTVIPVWIHIWWWNDTYSLMLLRRGALSFFKVIRQISRSHSAKGDGGGRPSSVMSLGVTSVGGHSHGHPASPIGVGSSWEDNDPRSPEPLVVRGGDSGWSGLYGGPLRPYTCEPYPTQLVCRELRPEGLVAWCPGMLRYGWQVHNMAHKSPGSIYILWPRPTW